MSKAGMAGSCVYLVAWEIAKLVFRMIGQFDIHTSSAWAFHWAIFTCCDARWKELNFILISNMYNLQVYT